MRSDESLEKQARETLDRFLDHRDPTSLAGRHVLRNGHKTVEARVFVKRDPRGTLLRVVLADGHHQADAMGVVRQRRVAQ